MDADFLDAWAERGRIRLRMVAHRMGADLLVGLSGGDRPHIGAVALGHPPGASTGATSELLALPGHREDALARELSARFAERLGGAVCVACGIHLEGILPSEIQDVLKMAEALADGLLDRLDPPTARDRALRG